MSEASASWGQVPQAIVDVVQLLSERIRSDNDHLRKVVWPTGPRDIQPLLRAAISDSHKIGKAGTELRSLLTAYAHQFHEPRPVMADLAKAQESTRQGIPRRYSNAMVDAIKELLSDQPNTAIIRHALTSLTRRDLEKIGGAVGEAARLENAGEWEKPVYAPQLKDSGVRGLVNVARRPSTPRTSSPRSVDDL